MTLERAKDGRRPPAFHLDLTEGQVWAALCWTYDTRPADEYQALQAQLREAGWDRWPHPPYATWADFCEDYPRQEVS